MKDFLKILKGTGQAHLPDLSPQKNKYIKKQRFYGICTKKFHRIWSRWEKEITLNVTSWVAANPASELPENFDFKLILKDKLVTAPSAVVSSKIVSSSLVKLIKGATLNFIL